MQKYNHYFRDVSHLSKIDIYRFCDLYGVTGPLEHALKKIACAGQRGAKDQIKDLNEAIDSIKRKLEMIEEDEARITNHQSNYAHWRQEPVDVTSDFEPEIP